MKRLLLLLQLLVCHLITFSQVGIGTTNPNPKALLDLNSPSKGILLPRMSNLQRENMFLSTPDEGMMVYQNSPTKGVYMFDGSGWVGLQKALMANTTGATLYWNEQDQTWITTTNLFNQGSSIGIGTTSPRVQLHINTNTNVPSTRLQITNPTTGNQIGDGLILGTYYSNGHAHLIQQENKPLTFGTNGLERIRIDSAGNTGIKTTHPTAALDVNGTAKIGTYGSVLTGIIRCAYPITLSLGPLAELLCYIPVPNVVMGSSVHISPGEPLTMILIEYARVSEPGMVEIKFMNMLATDNAPGEVMFYMTVIH